jgi:hypothetical protein
VKTTGKDLPVVMPWAKFAWDDWRTHPGLNACSLAARGLCMGMRSEAAREVPYGHVTINGRKPTDKQMANIIGIQIEIYLELLEELECAGIFSRAGDPIRDQKLQDSYCALDEQGVFGVVEPGTLYCRRMVLDLQTYRMSVESGRRGGNPNLVPAALRFRNDDAIPPYIPPAQDGLTPPLTGGPTIFNRVLESKKEKEERESKKEVLEAPLQDAEAPSSAKSDLFGTVANPAPAPAKPDKPAKPVRAERPQAQREAMTILAKIFGKDLKTHAKALAISLNHLRSTAGMDDNLVLDVIKQVQGLGPEKWNFGVIKWEIAWRVMGGRRDNPGPRLAVNNEPPMPFDPDDSWGVMGWCAASGFKPTEGDDCLSGKFYSPNGAVIIDGFAKLLGRNARLLHTWRGDWNVLVDWFNAGLAPRAILDGITATASYEGYDGKVVRSLHYFDKSVGYQRAA